MSDRRGAWRRRLWPAVAVALAAGGLFLFISQAESLPQGPQPVVWDKTPCAECRMAVSEPAYAAQLQVADGTVLNFDDPGCLFLYLDAADPQVHAVYLHHVREERWLPREQAGFVPAGPSPMDYGLGAVDREAEGGVSFIEARERVLSAKRAAGHAHD